MASLPGVIDLHCHVLPDLDDGPPDDGAALEMVRACAAAGANTLVATPHIDHRWSVQPSGVAARVEHLQSLVDDAGIPVRILPGGEVALPRYIELDTAELDAVRLGGGPYLLLETPHSEAAGDFHHFAGKLLADGEALVLAHPERCPMFLRRPERLAALVQAGALCSITAGSLEGQFGDAVRQLALTLLRQGLVHNVASDSHDAMRRRPGVANALGVAATQIPGLAALEDWLTLDVPAAILTGADLPERPALPRQSRTRRLISRLGSG
jgi:protein-tyrosine phosphatase